jgi:hypothetical protein
MAAAFVDSNRRRVRPTQTARAMVTASATKALQLRTVNACAPPSMSLALLTLAALVKGNASATGASQLRKADACALSRHALQTHIAPAMGNASATKASQLRMADACALRDARPTRTEPTLANASATEVSHLRRADVCALHRRNAVADGIGIARPTNAAVKERGSSKVVDVFPGSRRNSVVTIVAVATLPRSANVVSRFASRGIRHACANTRTRLVVHNRPSNASGVWGVADPVWRCKGWQRKGLR